MSTRAPRGGTGRLTAERRRALLERYLQAWLTTHAFTAKDLGRSEVLHNLLETLSADLAAVVGGVLNRSAEALADRLAAGATQLGARLLRRGAAQLLGWGGR